MEKTKSRTSMVRMVLELMEQSIVLVFLELKLAVVELRHNVESARNGAIFLVLGAGLLMFGLMTLAATAIAALAVALPVWLSALIVTGLLMVLGAACLFTGVGKVKHFSLLPVETIERVELIGKKLKRHAEEREEAQLRTHEVLREAGVRSTGEQKPQPERRRAAERRREHAQWRGPERRREPERRRGHGSAKARAAA